MKDNKRMGKTKCPNCGQLLGFEVKNPNRKTQLLKCPVCKAFSWTNTDTMQNCLVQLARYEKSSFSPAQVLMLRALWNECRKYPELKDKMDEWEAELNDIERKSDN